MNAYFVMLPIEVIHVPIQLPRQQIKDIGAVRVLPMTYSPGPWTDFPHNTSNDAVPHKGLPFRG